MRRNNKLKLRIIAVASCLILMCAIVGTLASFTQVKSVKNTFTFGSINITLTETDKEFKMHPEGTIHKNPVVTVKKSSLDSWIFVKAEESDNFKNYLSYEIRIGENEWQQLLDKNGKPIANVYYRSYSRNYNEDVEYYIIKNNEVKVLDSVTKKMLDDLREGKDTNPTLSFTAYGVEKAEGMTAYEAWKQINE